MIGEYPTLYYRENWLTEETGIFDIGCYSIKCTRMVGKRKRRKIDDIVEQDSQARIAWFNDSVTIHLLSITKLWTRDLFLCVIEDLSMPMPFRQSIDSSPRVYLHPQRNNQTFNRLMSKDANRETYIIEKFKRQTL